jgi:hypothetical protein
MLVNDIFEEPGKLVQDYSLTDGLAALILDTISAWQLKYKDLCLEDKKLQKAILGMILCSQD